MPLGADKLCAQRVGAGGNDEHGEQRAELPLSYEHAQQRQCCKQCRRSEQHSVNTYGEDLCPLLAPVGGKAEHPLRNVERSNRNEQIGRLRDEIGGAVFRRGEIAGIEPYHQEYQQLGAERPDADEGGVGGKSLITVHVADASLLRGRQS